MFDDQNNPQQPPRGQQPQRPPAPPSGAPGSPTPPTPPAPDAPQTPAEPEDIFATVDETAAQIKGPDQAGPAPAPIPDAGPQDFGSQGAAGPLPPPPPPGPGGPAPRPIGRSPELEEPRGRRIIKMVVLAVVVLAGIGIVAAAGWYGYNTFIAPSEPLPVNTSPVAQPTPPTPTPPVAPAAPQPPANINSATGSTEAPLTPPVRDSDRDGLSDEDERLYGTNIFKVDTDDDGLTDRDEVNVFKTDPNEPDTDGDGFLDGEEVRNGYDPKGPGQLLEIPEGPN